MASKRDALIKAAEALDAKAAAEAKNIAMAKAVEKDFGPAAASVKKAAAEAKATED